MLEVLNNYKFKEFGSDYNQYQAIPNMIPPTKDGAKEFNKVYQELLKSDLGELKRTPSGAIAKNQFYCWDIRNNPTASKLTILIGGKLWVVQLGYSGKENDGLAPYKAFTMFEDKCYEYGIELEDYALPGAGAAIKETIEKPFIFIDKKYWDKTLYNVHHIDFHSSYPAGLVNTHPEFRPVVEYFFNNRKSKPEYKAVLNYTIGMMQSLRNKIVNARYAILSRDAIKDNNDRIRALLNILLQNDYEIIGCNTDGIWYKGETLYHGEGEGDKLGEWSNDHTFCKFRAKSNGCYEFVENNVYTPVMRGCSTLDMDKPRSEWEWGDIYRTSAYVLTFEEGIGYTSEEIHDQ